MLTLSLEWLAGLGIANMVISLLIGAMALSANRQCDNLRRKLEELEDEINP